MLIDFTGKTAIVTGAAGGVGYACAKTLLESGAKMAVVDLSPEQAARSCPLWGLQRAMRWTCQRRMPSLLWWSRSGRTWAKWMCWCSVRG